MFHLNISNRYSDKDKISAIAVNLLLFLFNKQKTNWQPSRKFSLYRNNDLKCLKETHFKKIWLQSRGKSSRVNWHTIAIKIFHWKWINQNPYSNLGITFIHFLKNKNYLKLLESRCAINVFGRNSTIILQK